MSSAQVYINLEKDLYESYNYGIKKCVRDFFPHHIETIQMRYSP